MSQLSEKDQEIVEALKGDRASYRPALKDLMKRCSGKVIHYICKRGGTEEDARDIFQEGMIALMKNVRKGQFNGQSTIETYLFGICKQLFIHQVSRKKSMVSTDSIEEPSDAGLGNETFVQRNLSRERKVFFKKLINILGDTCRQYFEDKAMGYALEVYADRKNIQYQSAKNISMRCQRKLRDLLLEPHIQERLKEL